MIGNFDGSKLFFVGSCCKVEKLRCHYIQEKQKSRDVTTASLDFFVNAMKQTLVLLLLILCQLIRLESLYARLPVQVSSANDTAQLSMML